MSKEDDYIITTEVKVYSQFDLMPTWLQWTLIGVLGLCAVGLFALDYCVKNGILK